MAKMKKFLLFMFLCVGIFCQGQTLKVVKMKRSDTDITARTLPRYDLNGMAGALVKVQLPVKGATFKTPLGILGDVKDDNGDVTSNQYSNNQSSNNTNPTVLPSRTQSSNNSRETKGGKVYDVVEQMPQFPGGPNALFLFLAQSVKYPVVSEENGIQGRVIVTFTIECDGSISEVKVAKSVDPSLDQEAIRVVKSMPLWTPGKQNGSPVRVKYTVPVIFRLQ